MVIALLGSGALDVGGVEDHLLSLVRFADPTRYRFVVIAPLSPRLAEKLRTAGAVVAPWQCQGRFDRHAATELAALLEEHHVQLLHIHEARAGILGRWVARRRRLPVVVSVHTPSYYYDEVRNSPRKRWAYQRIEGLLNTFTDRVIYVSQRLYEEAVALRIANPNNAVVVANGIELAKFVDAAPLASISQHAATASPIFCFIGRLVEQKGADVLLDAVERLPSHMQPVTLWIVGDGPMRAELEARAAHLSSAARIHFWGFREDIASILHACDVLVMPSRYEAMPILLLEVLAAGKPSIVTETGDNSVIVRHEREGLVVKAEDAAELAAAMTRLHDAPALRATLGQAARERSAVYDIRQTAARVQEIYDTLLSREQP